MNNENLTFFNLNHHFCRHRNDGLYDFVLFVQYAKQEIPQRAVKQRKFWRFNVVVVYCNLLFLLLFGTFWYTLRRSRTPNQKFAKILDTHFPMRHPSILTSQNGTLKNLQACLECLVGRPPSILTSQNGRFPN